MSSYDLQLTVNGQPVSLLVEPQLLLVQLLREHLALTGTHVGCDTAQCGACTVLVGDRAIKACNMLAVQADGLSVTTIEGLSAKAGPLHSLQAAFKQHHGLQCGFCTPGMIMSACELLQNGVAADEREVAAALDGNLCRCTGYRGSGAAITETLAAAQQDSRGAV
jgi:aerobic carbon-monoxide dehydrogenase small subunit